MRQDRSLSSGTLGFLTVVEHPEQGLFGGYLVLNRNGRPLEFHCTAPLRPNRAQRILYGPSLAPFLYGEQIGATLVGHAKASPLAVLTDCEPALAVREYVELPVALVLPHEPETERGDASAPSIRFDPAHASRSDMRPHRTSGGELLLFEFGAHRLAVPRPCEDDRNLLTERLADLPGTFDLAEPFGRIHEAISEARKATR